MGNESKSKSSGNDASNKFKTAAKNQKEKNAPSSKKTGTAVSTRSQEKSVNDTTGKTQENKGKKYKNVPSDAAFLYLQKGKEYERKEMNLKFKVKDAFTMHKNDASKLADRIIKAENAYNGIALKNHGGFGPKEINSTLKDISGTNRQSIINALNSAEVYNAELVGTDTGRRLASPIGFVLPEKPNNIVMNSNSFKNGDTDDSGLLHEATHVAQLKGAAAYSTAPNSDHKSSIGVAPVPSSDKYDYHGALATGYLFLQLGIEQQADVVKDFYLGRPLQ
jgi:hypothetical protein